MTLLDPLFGDPEADALLGDDHRIATMLEVEVALAAAEAEAGVIPERCVAAIRQGADPALQNRMALAKEAACAGNLAIPLVRQLTTIVEHIDEEAARYVHWGATSQDILDTALVLQLRGATLVILRRLAIAGDAAAALARAHAGSVMAGRTWMQHATPVTFGLKAAGWLSALDRARERIGVALWRAMVLQLGGASGTLASLGEHGPSVAAAMAADLGLALPDLPWHAHRDRLAELACALAVAVGTLGKIARDVSLLAQTEVAEAFESARDGRGGSSTMPHKRNPVGASVAIAASLRAPGLVATMLAAMPQEHERGLGGWQAEWETLPELVHLAAGAARSVADMLRGLEVDAARMRENADMTHGLALAESVSMALAEHVGKAEAHRAVEEASRRAAAERRPLAAVLADTPEVTRYLGDADIARCLTADRYIGSASSFVNRALAHHASSQQEN